MGALTIDVATGTSTGFGGVVTVSAVVRTSVTGRLGDSEAGLAAKKAEIVVLGGGSSEATEVKIGESAGAAGTFENTGGNSGAVAYTVGAGTDTVAGNAVVAIRTVLGPGRWVGGADNFGFGWEKMSTVP